MVATSQVWTLFGVWAIVAWPVRDVTAIRLSRRPLFGIRPAVLLTTRGGSSLEGDDRKEPEEIESNETQSTTVKDVTEEVPEESIAEEENNLNGLESANEVPTEETPTEESERNEEPPVINEPPVDEDSSANIDRMDYADDEAEDAENVVETALKSSNKIPLVESITPDMRDTLVKQLKYRPGEVKRMRPDIAAVVVAKELQRPQEGLPPHWLVQSGGSKGGLSTKSIVLSVLTIGVAAVGGMALKNNNGLDSDFVWEPPTSLPVKSSEEAPTETIQELPETTTPVKETPDLFEHEHSLRPGEHPPSEPIDETALDKFLTVVEKKLAKLLFGR